MSPFLGTRGAGSSKAFDPGAGRPNQVTGLTATDFGTNRAYNNGRIDLSWTAPSNNGATITGYFIERSTNSGSTWSTLVSNTGNTNVSYSDTGLTSAQRYDYRVSAINAVGTGLASTAANATATTVPQAPTIGTASRTNDTTVSLTFTAGATGGKAITSYTATASPALAVSTSGTSSPLTVTGTYVVNTAYTFTITATNANGTSTASSASNSVTPLSTYTLLLDANTTQNYTRTGQYNQLRAILIAGGAGGGRNNSIGQGSRGGGGGGAVHFTDYAWNSGNISITIGAGGSAAVGSNQTYQPWSTGPSAGGSGGATSIAVGGTTIATANGGEGGGTGNSGGAGGSGSSNIGATVVSGPTGGAGGNGANFPGGTGGTGSTISYNTGGSVSIQMGGAGGGGGFGAMSYFSGGQAASGGGSGGALGGGNGGVGAPNAGDYIGRNGGNSNSAGAGGGGTGGSAGSNTMSGAQMSGAGSAGRVLIYGR